MLHLGDGAYELYESDGNDSTYIGIDLEAIFYYDGIDFLFHCAQKIRRLSRGKKRGS